MELPDEQTMERALTDSTPDEGLAAGEAAVNDELVSEALSLLVAVNDTPDCDAQRRLAVWQSQSAMHVKALNQARDAWQLMEHMNTPALGFSDRARLTLASHTASMVDHPQRLAIVCMLFAALLFGVDRWRSPAPEASLEPVAEASVFEQRFQTRRGQQEAVELPDGSSLWLDWNTSVTVRMDDARRVATLHRGKGRFLVAKQPDRPFSVAANGTAAVALGTEFVVHRMNAREIEVAVLEGVVAVADSGKPLGPNSVKLGRAQAIRVSGGQPGAVVSRPLNEIGSWRDGVLVFEGRSLREVFEALEPYSRFAVDTANVLDAEEPVSGSFLIRKADSAVTALIQTHGLAIEEQIGSRLVLRTAAPQRPD